ncbi:hypothetical protein RIF29_10467 [Crotalaria pallida]|uniref:Uncharacterized protein n=1 Tax=Crotalaria pallida TaxID=3830 RepID=A0AAN9IJW2_CROPI
MNDRNDGLFDPYAIRSLICEYVTSFYSDDEPYPTPLNTVSSFPTLPAENLAYVWHEDLITSIVPPSSSADDDDIAWATESSSEFFIPSAVDAILNQHGSFSSGNAEKLFELVWDCPGPQHICSLL